MRWTNFNISFPLLDRIAGTLETEEAWLASRKPSPDPATPATPTSETVEPPRPATANEPPDSEAA